MIVVSNTAPLHYLIAVDRAELLPQIFSRVHVPPAVIREMSHTSTPPPVRHWIMNRPAWLAVATLAQPLAAELAASLDQGEAEAIQLAEEKQANLLIIDEWKGRAVAQQRGLPLTGVLGILGLAYQKRMLDDPIGVLLAMRAKGFRIHDQLAARFQLLLQTSYAR